MFDFLWKRTEPVAVNTGAAMPEAYREPVSAREYWRGEILRLDAELQAFTNGVEANFKKRNFASVNGRFALLHTRGGDTGADRYAITESWKALVQERTRLEDARQRALIEHAKL